MNRVQLQTEKKSFYNYLKKRLKSLSSLTNNFQNSKLEYVDVVDCPCNLTFQDEKIFLWHDDYLKIGKSALRKNFIFFMTWIFLKAYLIVSGRTSPSRRVPCTEGPVWAVSGFQASLPDPPMVSLHIFLFTLFTQFSQWFRPLKFLRGIRKTVGSDRLPLKQ